VNLSLGQSLHTIETPTQSPGRRANWQRRESTTTPKPTATSRVNNFIFNCHRSLKGREREREDLRGKRVRAAQNRRLHKRSLGLHTEAIWNKAQRKKCQIEEGERRSKSGNSIQTSSFETFPSSLLFFPTKNTPSFPLSCESKREESDGNWIAKFNSGTRKSEKMNTTKESGKNGERKRHYQIQFLTNAIPAKEGNETKIDWIFVPGRTVLKFSDEKME